MFYCLEVEGPGAMEGRASLCSIAGVGETALAAQQDAAEYLNRIALLDGTPDPEGTGDYEYWEEQAGDSGFMLLTLELAAPAPEWEMKPCDAEREKKKGA